MKYKTLIHYDEDKMLALHAEFQHISHATMLMLDELDNITDLVPEGDVTALLFQTDDICEHAVTTLKRLEAKLSFLPPHLDA